MPSRRDNQVAMRRRGQARVRHAVIRQEWESSREGSHDSSKAGKAAKAEKARKA